MNRNVARGIRKLDRLRKQVSSKPVEVPPDPTGLDLRVYSTPDEDGSRAESFDELLSELRSRDIATISGGTNNPYRLRLNVYQEDVKGSLLAAVEIFGTERVWVRYRKRWEQIVPGSALDRALVNSNNVDALLLDEPLPPEITPFDEGVRITGLWFEVVSWAEFEGAYDRPYLESKRPNTVAKRLRRSSFDRLAEEQHHFGADLPPADVPNFPVDIVYTWVDGEDPEWLKAKTDVQAELGIETDAGSAAADERFRSRDELKYSLRSVEAYAPWVRKIHIVTASQCPDWLNVDHPKLELVDHKDIYRDPSWLPTFNSSGIETQLHRVPGLADKFIYFNDDFFLGQTTKVTDFFYGNGVLKYFPSSQMAYEHDIDETSEEYIQADKNAIELFSNEFDSLNRHIMKHVPYASDRLLIDEMEHKFSENFNGCGKEPFRSSNDLRPIAFMQYHYGYKLGRAMPSSISHRYLALWKDSIIEQLESVQRSRKYKTLCINDVGLQPERTAEVNNAVIEFLETYYPTPSSFEK